MKEETKDQKRKIVQVLSLAAAAIAALVVWQALRSDPRTDSSTGSGGNPGATALVGEIQSVEGSVLIRPSGGTSMTPATAGPLRAETLIQTQAASAVVIEFHPGPTIRLLENSRLVTETDPTQDSVIQATILSGEISILNPGTSSTFTLMQNGVAVDYSSGTIARTVPLIELGNGTNDPNLELEQKIEQNQELDNEAVSEAENAGVAPDLNALPTPTPTPTPAPGSSKQVAPQPTLLNQTLTNDDIRSQVRAQSGGFQKCYVGMVNRMTEAGRAAGSLPKGETRVAFKILPAGKVEDPKVLKSPFGDSVFDRCMTEALGRIRFKPFQGSTIPVAEFPILLE